MQIIRHIFTVKIYNNDQEGTDLVKSMTGFGRASACIEGATVTVEIKSVNHRYFELKILPWCSNDFLL